MTTENQLHSQPTPLQISFSLVVNNISEAAQAKALAKAREAYIMTLLAEGEISSGKAASLLDMSRLDMLEYMGTWGISIFDDSLTATELEQQVKQASEILSQSTSEPPAA